MKAYVRILLQRLGEYRESHRPLPLNSAALPFLAPVVVLRSRSLLVGAIYSSFLRTGVFFLKLVGRIGARPIEGIGREMAWRRTCALCLALGLQCLLILDAAAYEFTVGGRRGWAVPAGNKTDAFNQWAEQNRFQVGDTLVFRYKQGQDSVLRVSKEDYEACNTANPIESYNDGNTVFKFPSHGPFYFISGAAGNCQKGEKLIVVVLSPRNRSGGRARPAPAPAPSTASPPGIAPSPSISAPAPLVSSPPSKAPSPSTVSPVPARSPRSASAPFIASTPTPSPVQSPVPSAAAPASAPSVASPTPAPETSPASAPSVVSPTPAPVTSPASAPSVVSPTPASVTSPISAPSSAFPAPASLEAPVPSSPSAPSISPSTGTPPQSASSPAGPAPSAPPSAESITTSAAASVGFASALPLVVIIVSSLLN